MEKRSVSVVLLDNKLMFKWYMRRTHFDHYLSLQFFKFSFSGKADEMRTFYLPLN